MTRAVVLGDALLDVTLRPAAAMKPGGDVPGEVRIGPGGQGANVAVRLARMGIEVELVCAIGDDTAGRMVREALAADGVRIRPLPSGSTGAVAVLLDLEGERTMISQRTAFGDRLADVAMARADWLVVSGYLLLEDGAQAAMAALATAAAHRALVGCAVPADAVPRWRAAADALAPDLVVLNQGEAALADASVPAVIVVTTRPDGAEARFGPLRVEVAAVPTDGIVDTTGAGDALAATLVARLIRWPPSEPDLREALVAAVAAGSAVTRVQGAQGIISDSPGVGLAR